MGYSRVRHSGQENLLDASFITCFSDLTSFWLGRLDLHARDPIHSLSLYRLCSFPQEKSVKRRMTKIISLQGLTKLSWFMFRRDLISPSMIIVQASEQWRSTRLIIAV